MNKSEAMMIMSDLLEGRNVWGCDNNEVLYSNCKDVDAFVPVAVLEDGELRIFQEEIDEHIRFPKRICHAEVVRLMNDLRVCAMNLHEGWSLLSPEDDIKMATDYPFPDSFEIVVDKLSKWDETQYDLSRK